MYSLFVKSPPCWALELAHITIQQIIPPILNNIHTFEQILKKKKSSFLITFILYISQHIRWRLCISDGITGQSGRLTRWPSNLPSVLLKVKGLNTKAALSSGQTSAVENSAVSTWRKECIWSCITYSNSSYDLACLWKSYISCFIKCPGLFVNGMVNAITVVYRSIVRCGICSEQVIRFVSQGFSRQALVLSRGCGCIFKPFL